LILQKTNKSNIDVELEEREPNMTVVGYTLDTLERFKDKLSAEHFNVLRASLSGQSYSATAATLSIKVGTVKSRLNRARIALGKLVEQTARNTPNDT
jgi:DNA-directed RNA polymerase specialized sigma24 family protein